MQVARALRSGARVRCDGAIVLGKWLALLSSRGGAASPVPFARALAAPAGLLLVRI